MCAMAPSAAGTSWEAAEAEAGWGFCAGSLSPPGTSGHHLCFRNPFPEMSDAGLGPIGDVQVLMATEPSAQLKPNWVNTRLLSRNGKKGPDDQPGSSHPTSLHLGIPSESPHPGSWKHEIGKRNLHLPPMPHYSETCLFLFRPFSGGARAPFSNCAAKTTP